MNKFTWDKEAKELKEKLTDMGLNFDNSRQDIVILFYLSLSLFLTLNLSLSPYSGKQLKAEKYLIWDITF